MHTQNSGTSRPKSRDIPVIQAAGNNREKGALHKVSVRDIPGSGSGIPRFSSQQSAAISAAILGNSGSGALQLVGGVARQNIFIGGARGEVCCGDCRGSALALGSRERHSSRQIFHFFWAAASGGVTYAVSASLPEIARGDKHLKRAKFSQAVLFGGSCRNGIGLRVGMVGESNDPRRSLLAEGFFFF